MRIVPYILGAHQTELVCWLTADGCVVDEHGRPRDLERWDDGWRCFASWDTVRTLVLAGEGEALCWNGEEIRWRHEPVDEPDWKPRPSDVHVLRLPLPDDDVPACLAALVQWRDWLQSHGAGVGSFGSASWSLLRGTLREPLWTSAGENPPLKQTLGGRQQLGPAGQGSFTGELRLYDLPAAYASTLAGLPYGGRWIRDDGLPSFWARGGRPVFARAVVRVPDLLGPLPRRPRKPVYGLAAMILQAQYPRATKLQGVWSWDELATAEQHGTRILRVKDLWVHVGGERVFEPWWEAILEGRDMGGLAGQLAKTTGNALWGQFCMNAAEHGQRSILGGKGRRFTRRLLAKRKGRPPDHGLAETVSGRVRARLYGAMLAAGAGLVSAHTDGVWVHEGSPGSFGAVAAFDGWRLKAAARRLDVLDPQSLRWWPRREHPGEPFHVLAGEPAGRQAEAFESRWGEWLNRERVAA